jgi:RNA polymerase sigma-70 factor, ECF subfamily
VREGSFWTKQSLSLSNFVVILFAPEQKETMPGFSELPSKAGVTQLLKAWSEGDDVALEQLTPVVENELRRIAHRCMMREKPDHILESAALVNEVYLRLVDIQAVSWQDRTHFFAMCARLMRRILTDYARSRNYQKRGGGVVHHRLDSLDQGLLVAPEKQADILALDEALTQFALLYPRQSQVVELRFFGGLEVDEVAETLKISAVTVKRDWKFAKAWLLRSVSGEVRDGS